MKWIRKQGKLICYDHPGDRIMFRVADTNEPKLSIICDICEQPVGGYDRATRKFKMLKDGV